MARCFSRGVLEVTFDGRWAAGEALLCFSCSLTGPAMFIQEARRTLNNDLLFCMRGADPRRG